MGRSVSYPAQSELVVFTHFDSQDEWGWEDTIDNLKFELQNTFRSLVECDEWLGREDHAILENNLIHVGVSEYCGLVAVWMRSKEGSPFGVSFIGRIEKNARRIISDCFGLTLLRVGTFSNGESVFTREVAQ